MDFRCRICLVTEIENVKYCVSDVHSKEGTCVYLYSIMQTVMWHSRHTSQNYLHFYVRYSVRVVVRRAVIMCLFAILIDTFVS